MKLTRKEYATLQWLLMQARAWAGYYSGSDLYEQHMRQVRECEALVLKLNPYKRKG